MIKVKDIIKKIKNNKWIIIFDDNNYGSKVQFVGRACDTPKHYHKLNIYKLTINDDATIIRVKVFYGMI